MDDPDQAPAAALAEAVEMFLRARSPWASRLDAALGGRAVPHRLFLFGGLLRDLTVHGRWATPRDVDLVVHGIDSTELLARLRPYVERETRFGGLQLRIEGTEIDLWPLTSTWAFRHQKNANPRPEDLPATTFLTVEAVAVEVHLSSCRADALPASRFFRSVREKVLDINYADNPYPLACVARSLDLATRIGFAIGSQLSAFAAGWLAKASPSDLAEAHARSHGTSPRPERLFRAWRDAIERAGPGEIVKPPLAHV